MLRSERADELSDPQHAQVPNLLALPDPVEKLLPSKESGDILRSDRTIAENLLHVLDGTMSSGGLALVGERLELGLGVAARGPRMGGGRLRCSLLELMHLVGSRLQLNSHGLQLVLQLSMLPAGTHPISFQSRLLSFVQEPSRSLRIEVVQGLLRPRTLLVKLPLELDALVSRSLSACLTISKFSPQLCQSLHSQQRRQTAWGGGTLLTTGGQLTRDLAFASDSFRSFKAFSDFEAARVRRVHFFSQASSLEHRAAWYCLDSANWLRRATSSSSRFCVHVARRRPNKNACATRSSSRRGARAADVKLKASRRMLLCMSLCSLSTRARRAASLLRSTSHSRRWQRPRYWYCTLRAEAHGQHSPTWPLSTAGCGW
eukprot:6198967-Pleurochrysis_carterae.AAC.2